MDLATYIKDCKLVLQRTNGAETRSSASKMKALRVLDAHDKKWDQYYEDIVYVYLKYEDVNVIYSDVNYQWRIIYDSLTDDEKEVYGSTLDDTYNETDYCKNYMDWVQKCTTSATEKMRAEKCEYQKANFIQKKNDADEESL